MENGPSGMNPLERATLPNQYDSADLLWAKEGKADSTRTQFFWEYLEPYSRSWKDKSVLDVGAGTGWLVQRALELGATQATGIEPSAKNVALGRQQYPNANLVQSTFESYDNQGKQFDEVLGVMSFSHIADMDAAFQKLRDLLKPGGEILIIVPDYDYSKSPRHDYALEAQPIDDASYAISVTRSNGTISDVVRKTSVYQTAAESAGFELLEDTGMKPTENQIAKAPTYAQVKDQAITRLLRFGTKSDGQ